MRKYDKTMECILALTPSFSELWKDKINPERSLLYEVVKVAEVLEIVHLVGSWIGHQFGKGNDIPGGSKKFSNNPPCAMDGEGKDETNPSSTNDQQQSKKQNYQHQGSLDKKLKGGKHLTNKFQLSKEGHDMLLHINCALSTKSRTLCKHMSREMNCFRWGFFKATKDGQFQHSHWHRCQKLCELADTTEQVDQLELNSCELMLANFMLCGENDDCHECMGDLLVWHAEHVLVMCLPYLLDNILKMDTCKTGSSYIVSETCSTAFRIILVISIN